MEVLEIGRAIAAMLASAFVLMVVGGWVEKWWNNFKQGG